MTEKNSVSKLIKIYNKTWTTNKLSKYINPRAFQLTNICTHVHKRSHYWWWRVSMVFGRSRGSRSRTVSRRYCERTDRAACRGPVGLSCHRRWRGRYKHSDRRWIYPWYCRSTGNVKKVKLQKKIISKVGILCRICCQRNNSKRLFKLQKWVFCVKYAVKEIIQRAFLKKWN